MAECRAIVYKPDYGTGNWWVETYGVLRTTILHVRETWDEAMQVAIDWTERGVR